MNPSAYKVALIHMSKTQENSQDEETPEDKQVDEQLTLAQKKKVIDARTHPDHVDISCSPPLERGDTTT